MESNVSHATEIYPGLWLGDIIAASAKHFLKNKRIHCIFNCTVAMPFTDSKEVTTRIRVPVKDNLQIDQIYMLYKYLDKIVNIIFKQLQQGHNVLVHCHAGKQRSVTVIAAFLMKYGDMSKDEAIDTLRTKRSVAALPEINFDQALIQYEKMLIELKKNL